MSHLACEKLKFGPDHAQMVEELIGYPTSVIFEGFARRCAQWRVASRVWTRLVALVG
jgi:hypothetical protein